MINKEQKKEYDRKYLKKNREKILKYQREFYKKNKETINERSRRYYRDHKEELLEKGRKYHLENKDERHKAHRKYREKYKDRINKASREWCEKNKFELRKKAIERKYGLKVAEYEKLVLEQKNLCAICEKRERVSHKGQIKELAVDHDHETGKVRGLLCHSCNLAIGVLLDKPELFKKAAEYLVKHKK